MQAPKRFNAEGLVINQEFATSRDGEKIPYFIIHKKDLKKDGKNPTLLYGYGGFEVSLTPSCAQIAGKLWLERGGVYVLSNIRGGGEYGPRWHQAALLENRQKAYDDFTAIAFSDELKVPLFGSVGRDYCWRAPGEDFDDPYVAKRLKYGGGNLMMWGCMTGKGLGRITRIYGRMDAKLYVEILKDDLRGTLRDLGINKRDIYFQQDNDSKHTSKFTKT